MRRWARKLAGLGLLTVAAAAPAVAQATLEWRALHPGAVAGSTFATHAVVDPWGNVTVAFETRQYPPRPVTELVAYTSGGEVLWVGPPLPLDATGLQRAANGDLLLCGNSAPGGDAMHVLRVGPKGVRRWQRTIAGASAMGLALDAQDRAVVVGSAGGDWLVQAFASDGTTAWVTHLDGPAGLPDTANCVVVDAAGDLLVGGNVGSWSYHTDAAVAKLTGAGELLWLTDWSATAGSESYTMIVSDGQGGAVAAGTVAFSWSQPPYGSYVNHQFTRFDADGDVAWLYPDHGIPFYSFPRDVLVDDSGQVWAAIHVDPYVFSKSVARLDCIGPGGHGLASTSYDGPTHTGAWPAGLLLDEAGRVVLGVTSGDPFGGHDHRSALMRVTPDGLHLWTDEFAGPTAGLSTSNVLPAPDGRVVMVGRAWLAGAFEGEGLVMQAELEETPGHLEN